MHQNIELSSDLRSFLAALSKFTCDAFEEQLPRLYRLRERHFNAAYLSTLVVSHVELLLYNPGSEAKLRRLWRRSPRPAVERISLDRQNALMRYFERCGSRGLAQ